MAILVDEAVWPFRGKLYCHMASDTDNMDELHAFAAKLGLKRAWFQADKAHPHYDISANKREQAIRLGAQAVTQRELVMLWINRRKDA